ncbi:pyridoxal-phosphate dependent enzyme [Algimonas porphyrae]|nr:pyridoxal-phosphate dependent enzyme [Algimonas porphyrae]
MGIAHLPTPLHPLNNLSQHLGGPRIWVKRDDLTGLGTGGNKLRKIDYALRDVLDAGADCVVSGGVVQSNSARQVAAACAAAGIPCHLAVFEGRVEAGSERYYTSGNALLSDLFGATKHPMPWSSDPNQALKTIASRLRADGFDPAILPYGVSSPMGAIGYATLIAEIGEQMDRAPAAIIFASGSGGTHAGIAMGCQIGLQQTQAIGFDIDAQPDRVRQDTAAIMLAAGKRLGWIFDLDAIDLRSGMAGPSYGVPHEKCLEAMRLAGRLEGLVLDPTYSAKSLAGLISLVMDGTFDKADDIVFVHTGGDAAIFAYEPSQLGLMG